MAIKRVFLEIDILKRKGNTNENCLYLIVKNQPFVGYNFFEEDDKTFNSFRASNGFTLASSSMIELANYDFLYLRGDNEDNDFVPIEILQDSIEDGFIDRLKIAVREYNSYLVERYDRLDKMLEGYLSNIDFDYSYTPEIIPEKKVLRVLL